jgi:peptidoglycan hydrolase-like protein with peptidoglycan-binding domain
MHRRRLAALAAICSLALAAVLTGSSLDGVPLDGPSTAAAVPARQGSQLLNGINVEGIGPGAVPGQERGAIASAHQLHVKVIRVDFPWAIIEPTQGATDSRALASADRIITEAAADGIKVSATVGSTPCWDSSAPPTLLRKCVPGRDNAANRWPPLDDSAYAAFVAFLAQRYGSRLAAIEVWNEPDQANEDYFAGPGKPAAYAAVLRAAYPAIKLVAPEVPVLGGSLVGSNGVFLRKLYAAGIKGFYDGLSVHFYTLTLAALRATHELQLKEGDHTPLWLDEFGWSSCWPRQRVQQEQGCVTSQVQAENVRNTFRAVARATYVAAADIYKLQDSPNQDFGMLTRRGARKPAFAALAGVGVSPLGPLSPVTLSLARKGRSVLATGSGPVGDFMKLEAFQGGRLRYRALFTLDRFNRYSLTLPAALGTSGLTIKVLQYTVGQSGLAQRSI